MMQKEYHNMTGDKIQTQEREVYRYLGYAGVEPDETVQELVKKCIEEMKQASMPKSVYQIFEITKTAKKNTSTNDMETEAEAVLDLGFARVESQNLAKNLKGCEKVMVTAATLGPRPDLLIQRNSRLDPLKGVVMQAVGAMLIESYLDEQNEKWKRNAAEEGYRLHPRFSPGYGDFSLEHQRDIFRVLDCSRNLGLTLMDSLIMAPSKSVTAVIGMEPAGDKSHIIEEIEEEKVEEKCRRCENTDCPYKTR